MNIAVATPPDEEQHRRCDEGNQVPLLVLVQRRGDEAPQLPEHHRGREGDSSVHADLEPCGETLQGTTRHQVALRDVLGLVVQQEVAVGPQHERDDRVVQKPHDHAPEEHRHDRDDHSFSKLGEVLEQGHGPRVHLRGRLVQWKGPGPLSASGGSRLPVAGDGHCGLSSATDRRGAELIRGRRSRGRCTQPRAERDRFLPPPREDERRDPRLDGSSRAWTGD